MSSPAPSNNKTIQQRRERILQAQAATTTSPGGGNCKTGSGVRGGDGEDRGRGESQERLAEEAAAEVEEEREWASAFAKLVEENKKEKERAAEDLEKRQKHTAKSHRGVDVEIPVPPSGSRQKTFKSKAVISDDSDEEVEGKGKESAPRGVKRKRTIKMIAKGDNTSVPNALSQHIIGERRFKGPGIAEQLATIAEQNKALLDVARRSLILQERILHLMVIRERREEDAEKNEDEDEDGEGEDDEGEIENEERRAKIREGKKRAE
ncbi:hypothetical protein F5890DRAFT_1557915 [Lentinula detonsa]|uniref:Uncharacterized protein n=1 Tax=Lentinula detonsa TaxID=2804962 RepID=A0AA38PRY4_9AGAR|nr:hypothetical protein F5890DRAFT_1557915 [Lentinula detonsa]